MPGGPSEIPDHKSASGKEWRIGRGRGGRALERIENVGSLSSAVITETESAANDGQACRLERVRVARHSGIRVPRPRKVTTKNAEITSRDD